MEYLKYLRTDRSTESNSSNIMASRNLFPRDSSDSESSMQNVVDETTDEGLRHFRAQVGNVTWFPGSSQPITNYDDYGSRGNQQTFYCPNNVTFGPARNVTRIEYEAPTFVAENSVNFSLNAESKGTQDGLRKMMNIIRNKTIPIETRSAMIEPLHILVGEEEKLSLRSLFEADFISSLDEIISDLLKKPIEERLMKTMQILSIMMTEASLEEKRKIRELMMKSLEGTGKLITIAKEADKFLKKLL